MYRSHPDRDLLEHALSVGVRALDTAFNYRSFTAHVTLARDAGDLLGEFALSTKVGFFPAASPSDHAAHSLDPTRLREAVNQSVDDLGRTPDVVFLHNPERSLATMCGSAGSDHLAAACDSLADAVAAGLCTRWGIASWDPRAVVNVLATDVSDQPEVLLVRAGLSVAEPVLRAAEQLADTYAVPPARRWGMSPFGGSMQESAWSQTKLDVFLRPDQRCSTPQAAFRVAFAVPDVAHIAVGTRSAGHLRELVDAIDLEVDAAAVARYRRLIATADSR